MGIMQDLPYVVGGGDFFFSLDGLHAAKLGGFGCMLPPPPSTRKFF